MKQTVYEVRVVGNTPSEERWIATFRVREDAENYVPSEGMPWVYNGEPLEIVKVEKTVDEEPSSVWDQKEKGHHPKCNESEPCHCWEKYGKPRPTGRVKWFNDAKGFGFITPDEKGPDLFVHFTAIQSEGFRSLTEGDKVEFEIYNGPKGLQTKEVRKI